jgi:hypothetical protein
MAPTGPNTISPQSADSCTVTTDPTGPEDGSTDNVGTIVDA